MLTKRSSRSVLVAVVSAFVVVVVLAVALVDEFSAARPGGEAASVVSAPLAGLPMPAVPADDPDERQADVVAPIGRVEIVAVARDDPFRMAAGEPIGVSRVFRGRVIDEQGRPVRGATVRWLADKRTRALIGDSAATGSLLDVMPWVRTDGRGRFELGVSMASTVVPTGQSPDGDHASELLVTAHGHAPAVVQEPDLRARVCDVGNIQLGAARSIFGRAVDESGRPFPRIQAVFSVEEGGWTIGSPAIWDGNDLGLWQDLTGPDGRFRIGELPAAAGTLALRGNACSVMKLAIDQDAGNFAAVDLGDVVLERSELLRGKVVSPDGRGIPGAIVVPVDESMGWGFVPEPSEFEPCWMSVYITMGEQRIPYGITYTEQDGSFEIGRPTLKDDRPASVLAGAPGHGIGLARVPAVGDPGPTLILGRVASPSIRVVRADSGAAIPDARVLAYRGCELRGLSAIAFERPLAVRPATGGSNGATHVVEDWAEPGGYLLVTGEGLELRMVWMTADTPANPPVEIALESEARIEGRIRDEQGKPVAGAIVCGRAAGKETLFFSSGRLDPGMRFAVTDEEGRYALEHLSAGAWSVECRGPASHMMGYATNLSVQPGETLDGVDLAVEAEWMFRPSDG